MSRVDEDLISNRLRRAQETLEDAALLLQNRRQHSAVNRLYYALFYGVLALLQTKGLSSSKHQGVRALLNREFVKTGLLSREFGQFYRELFEDWQEGDYVDYVEFTEEETRERLKRCTTHLEELKALVIKLASPHGKV